jgi:hypothetical protein
VVNDGKFEAVNTTDVNELINEGTAAQNIIINGGWFVNPSTKAACLSKYTTINDGYIESAKAFSDSTVTINGGTVKIGETVTEYGTKYTKYNPEDGFVQESAFGSSADGVPAELVIPFPALGTKEE